MNWHCFSSVVTCPKIVEMMLPEPVSTMADSVVGPFGLMSGRGFSVALPDLPVVRLTHVTFNGNRCSAAGAGVPIAVTQASLLVVPADRGPGNLKELIEYLKVAAQPVQGPWPPHQHPRPDPEAESTPVAIADPASRAAE